jgi:signal peptide peptidase SppA
MNTALSYVNSQPWMIVPEYLELIVSVASQERDFDAIAKGIAEATEKREERESSPAALAMKRGEPLGDNKRVRVRDGVAMINVVGPIVRHADFFSDISGATSTESIARNFGQALNAPGVNSILLFIDSPGGEAFGIGELAAMINERAIDKPVTAYIGGYGASAAYYIASAADEVVVDSSAMIGSIGTVMEASDYSKAYESRGIRKHQYVSEQSPKKRPKMGTESGDSQMQELVNDMAQVFVEDVARFRGVTVEKVLSDFGQGGMMVGKKAVDAGLADRIGSFEATLKDMADGKGKRKKRMPTATAETDNQKPESGNDGGITMNLWDQLKNALSGEAPTATTPPTVPQNVPNIPHAIAPPAPSAESEEVKKLKAENAKLKQDTFKAQAESFINGKILAREVLPAAKEPFIRDYVRAALDDEANPVASGEPSRVDALKARYEGKPHKMTMELVPSQLKGAVALDNADDPEAAELEQAAASAKAFAERMNGKKAS